MGQVGADRGGITQLLCRRQQLAARPGEHPRQLVSDLFEALRRDLQNAGVNAKDLDDVIAQLQQLGNEGAYGNPEGIGKLQQAALEKLQTFEFNLRKKAEPNQDSLALSGSDEVPAGFRDQIAEYYRQLAKNKK